jgi:hypothetical protein
MIDTKEWRDLQEEDPGGDWPDYEVTKLLAEIDRLNAELAQLKEADRWIPVFDGETLVGFQHGDDFNLLPPAPDMEAK